MLFRSTPGGGGARRQALHGGPGGLGAGVPGSRPLRPRQAAPQCRGVSSTQNSARPRGGARRTCAELRRPRQALGARPPRSASRAAGPEGTRHKDGRHPGPPSGSSRPLGAAGRQTCELIMKHREARALRFGVTRRLWSPAEGGPQGRARKVTRSSAAERKPLGRRERCLHGGCRDVRRGPAYSSRPEPRPPAAVPPSTRAPPAHRGTCCGRSGLF